MDQEPRDLTPNEEKAVLESLDQIAKGDCYILKECNLCGYNWWGKYEKTRD